MTLQRPKLIAHARGREAQFRLELAKPGSIEAAQAVSDIERFREEYQAAHESVAERA